MDMNKISEYSCTYLKSNIVLQIRGGASLRSESAHASPQNWKKKIVTLTLEWMLGQTTSTLS